MRRFSLGKKLWRCLSLLALVGAATSANAQMPVNVTASAGPISPDWSPAPVDQSYPPATAALSASVPNPPSAPYNCTLNGPNWVWGIQTANVQYSTDNSNWTTASGGYSAWIVAPDPSSSAATFNVTFQIGGYWKFPCNVGIYYDDNPCGDNWFGTTSCLVNAQAAQLLSLTVASGATQNNVTGATNWAAVKSGSGVVVIQAKTLPDNALAWLLINWSGGNIWGANNSRSVNKSTSAMTAVRASIGINSGFVNIWILWANIQILTANPKPVNAPNFGPEDDGTENLGAVTYMVGDTQYGAGKICAVATITSAGVNAVVQTGWEFKRDRMIHRFDDGVKDALYYDTDWLNDTSVPKYTKLNPDEDDKIYDIDGPNVGQFINANDTQTYINFRQYVQWNGDYASDYGNWYYRGRWQAAQNPQITLNDVGTGNITLPDNPVP